MNSITAVDTSLFFSKNDPLDLRLGDRAKQASLNSVALESNTTPSYFVYGYPDDEGIRLNSGRPGAKEAPDRIRQFLYKMTPSLNEITAYQILDLGNLEVGKLELAARHEEGKKIAKKLTANGKTFVAFGGGHDYGYCESMGFCEAILENNTNKKPVVLNFDAHLDVRPTDKGFHSGTPFFRLLDKLSSQISFYEIGIQDQCNSRNHLEWLKSKNGKTLRLDQVLTALQAHKEDPIFISLDIDVFSSTEAPGCSQSWVSGIHYKDFQMVFSELVKNYQVCGVGIYEVSPPLDFDNHTSKLAAKITHDFMTMKAQGKR